MKIARLRLIAGAALLCSALGSFPARADRIYIRVAPPAAIVEERPPIPGPGHIWIGGYHRWDGARYVWVPGRWELPPQPHVRWVAGHWGHHHRHGWYWVEGHWR